MKKIIAVYILIAMVILYGACSDEGEKTILKDNSEYRVTGKYVFMRFEIGKNESVVLETGDEVIYLGESITDGSINRCKYRVLKVRERALTPLHPMVGMEGYIMQSDVENKMKILK